MKVVVRHRLSCGSALVSTLLVIVVLAIIVTAFLQSMSAERQTARSYLNREKASLAADAAQNEAINLVRELFTKYPDSVTWWDPDLAGKGVAGTAFSYYGTEAATDATKATANNSFYIPLVSGATATSEDGKAGSITLNGDEPDLNSNSSPTLSDNGARWVGAVPGTTAPTIRAPWVYLKTADGDEVSRFAFWIEDASFRVNVNVAKDKPRGTDTDGSTPSQIGLQGAFLPQMSEERASATATGIVSLRNELATSLSYPRLLSPSQINFATATDTDLYKDARFLITPYSSGLNLSRIGARRINLNAIVPPTGSNAAINADEMQKQLDQIKAAIAYRPAGSSAPEFNFGNRFYRTSLGVSDTENVGTLEREIYITKIAANIRDYLDSDSSPTQVLDDGSVDVGRPERPAGDKVTNYVDADNDFWAIGKENVPFLTKTMVHVAQIQPMSRTSNTFNIRISYYFEFWNMGTKDIVLGNGTREPDDTTSVLDESAFIRVGNQPGWIDTGPSGAAVIRIQPDRPREIPLSAFGQNLRFPAGRLTVLTTDPNWSAVRSSFGIPADSIFYAAGHDETFFGQISARSRSGDGYGGYPTLDIMLRPQLQANPPAGALWDNQTYVLLGDNNGLLDSERAAIPIKPGIYIDGFGQKNNVNSMHFRGGTLPGNLPTAYDMSGVFGGRSGGFPNQRGDPRANVDALKFDAIGNRPPATLQPPQSPGFTSWRDESSQSADTYKIYSVLGYMRPPTSGKVAPNAPAALNPFDSDVQKRWDDAGSSLAITNALDSNRPGSFAVIANAPMKSIGELGNIYDPAYVTTEAANLQKARGGGRTLRIGQSEQNRYANDPAAQWTGEKDKTTRSRVAWRLCDIFSTQSDLRREGLINPNGVRRDGGAALLAALNGFKFAGDNPAISKASNEGESSVKDKALAGDREGQALAESLIQYLQTNGPLRERGQLSELSVFNKGSDLNGVDMASAADRTREQLFRRLVELTTTKGNTFIVYILGQSLRAPGNGGTRQILATVKRKVTFRVDPVFADPSLGGIAEPTFDPEDEGRFATPISYNVTILDVGP